MLSEESCKEIAKKLKGLYPWFDCKPFERELLAVSREGDAENPEAFASVTYSNEILYFITKPITLGRICFNEFSIRIDLDSLTDLMESGGVGNPNYAIKVKALEPIRPDYPHPHLSTRELCYGDHWEICARLLNFGNIIDAVRMVNTILHNYGPDPYRKLEDYMDQCEDCGIGNCNRCVCCSVLECSNCGSEERPSGKVFCKMCIAMKCYLNYR